MTWGRTVTPGACIKAPMASPEPTAGHSTAIAMVATSSPRLPDAGAIVEAVGRATAPPGERPETFFIDDEGNEAQPQWDDGRLVFALGDSHVAVSLMPKPIPWSQLEGPCASSWWWSQAAARMRRHTHHFLVAVIGGTIEPVERRIVLTHVVGAVLRGADAVGVYWSEATIVHEPKEFLRQAESISRSKIPGALWIDVTVERNADGSFRAFTSGLEPLGYLEIEVERSRMKSQELMGFVGDTACYIVNNRRTVKAGETIGRTPEQRFVVGRGPSMLGRGEVMKLEGP